ncbi:MAG: hypothetical protein AAGJ70_11135 [Pseudomonadota bacterium]
MAGNFHEDFAQGDVPMPKPRATGIVFTVVAVIVAVFFRDTSWVWGPALGIAGCLGLLAWHVPHRLEPLNRAWFRFGMLLHKVVNPLVMAIMFAVAIIPMGLGMQLVRDPLRKKAAPEGQSYWIDVDPETATGTSMKNQF